MRKRYASRTVALDGVDLSVAGGERLAVLGRSGCGKTTLLRVIAGLERPDSGRVTIGGVDITDAAPHTRGVAMVMQSGSLYPHLRVRANIEFPLRMRGMARSEIDRRVGECAELLDISGLLDRRPASLSGGEAQRVALARALANPTAILLLDEPFGALDAPLRTRLRNELRAILDRVGRTTIMVTHDQEEAIALGHRVAVMEAGRVLQVGHSEELLRSPTDRRVASFLGSPPMAFINVTVRREHGAWFAESVVQDDDAPWRVRLPGRAVPAEVERTEAVLGMRGGLDWLDLRAADDGAPNDRPAEETRGESHVVVRGNVVGIDRLGGHVDVRFRLGGATEVTVRRPPDFDRPVGMPLAFAVPASAIHLFGINGVALADSPRPGGARTP